MTASIGFRAATATAFTQELLHQLAEDMELPEPGARETIYRDAGAPATATPGRLPDSLRAFARSSLQRALQDGDALDRAIGILMTEPKPQVWFDGADEALPAGAGVQLDRRSRMAYDERHVFINGEAFRAGGRDARLMRQLADARRLSAREAGQLSAGAQALLADWVQAGWVRQAA